MNAKMFGACVKNIKRNLLFKAFRLLFDRRDLAEFDPVAIKRVLFLQHQDKLGDAIVSSCVYRVLDESGYCVDVLSGSKNSILFTTNPNIRNVIIACEGWRSKLNWFRTVRAENYDLIVDMTDRKTRPRDIFVFRVLNAKHMVCFNKKYANLFTVNIDYREYNAHFTRRYEYFLKAIAIDKPLGRYELFVSSVSQLRVDRFLWEHDIDRFIVINPYGATSRRSLSLQQFENLVGAIVEKNFGLKILVVGSPGDIAHFSENKNVIVPPFVDFSDAIRIVEKTELVITPDTSIVHVAAAFQKNTVALYGNRKIGRFINNDVWAPNNSNAIQIVEEKHNDVKLIDVSMIVDAVQSLLRKDEGLANPTDVSNFSHRLVASSS